MKYEVWHIPRTAEFGNVFRLRTFQTYEAADEFRCKNAMAMDLATTDYAIVEVREDADVELEANYESTENLNTNPDQ